MYEYKLSYEHNGEPKSSEGKVDLKKSGVDLLWERLVTENRAVVLVDVAEGDPAPTFAELLEQKGYTNINVEWL